MRARVLEVRAVFQKCKIGEPGGTRTRDHRIKSAMLYQLSYRPAVRNFCSAYHSHFCRDVLRPTRNSRSPALFPAR